MRERALIGKFSDGHNGYDYILLDPATLAIIMMEYEHADKH